VTSKEDGRANAMRSEGQSSKVNFSKRQEAESPAAFKVANCDLETRTLHQILPYALHCGNPKDRR
jgi:hypothetical protein